MQTADARREILIPLDENGETSVAAIVERLARAAGVVVDRAPESLKLATRGLAGPLTRELLKGSLGQDVEIRLEPRVMRIVIDARGLDQKGKRLWARRLADLAAKAHEAEARRAAYGMKARPSYRPNDPRRPTVCLVHGMNSSSGGYVYMIPLLEEAGYGVVLHDYPFNRPIAESCKRFVDDWNAFRRKSGDTTRWTIVAHSMGALLARSLVEDDRTWRDDVRSLIMLAPANHGSYLAKAQTILQLLHGMDAVQKNTGSRALLRLSDGVGLAANDLLPASAFLKAANARPRRKEVAYHILAGDVGLMTRDARRTLEAQLGLDARRPTSLGRMVRTVVGDPSAILDEIADGTGDGCVALERAKLKGVDDFQVIHANHAEIIRAPALFTEPGPVACMPHVLRWLREDRAARAGEEATGR